ncbi:putative bifunctional diguanylate cyclase/phosphodiesterase [Blastomonas natatoria]|uniref:putative bifunctional diguanylate cyclase/phosphodiesterase n=1 Tax=Blastomonas natatoria TaxID=34015 RepID=UPI000D765667|nr:EAL domain-containing protein [Blastomonas natatoria]
MNVQQDASANTGSSRTDTLSGRVTRSRDFVVGGIMTAAIVMFVGSAGSVLPDALGRIYGQEVSPDNIAVTALLLNIALIIFGWRRYGELHREIAHHKYAEEQAKTLAVTDPLTGCLNRRAIGEASANLIAQAARRDMTVAYLMIDLDNFKNINDIQGHDAGDKVLVEVAQRLKATMPPNSHVARLGGDEFACTFIFDADFPETVQRVAEDLIEQVSKPITGPASSGTAELTVTASIGIARADQCENSLDVLMRRADIAMYASKKHGRNRYCWFDPRMENEVQFRNKIESGMRIGISRGEFVPYYEQQIDLNTGMLIGFEVLARWNSPELGQISPEIFIPIAEDTGMIGDLSASVMRQAMEDARGWDQSLTISVNISPVQLRDPWLAQKIVKLLVETGFPASRLEIEITESCLFENMGLAQSIIGSLKNQGVRVALDDFGTGYSSLAHLRALPFDRIKIDRSFVTSMNESKESRAIVQTIALLGESMGLPITAEGIEDGELIAHLAEIGCAKGQGFHFGQPLSIEQARRLLAERNMLGLGWTPQPVPQDDAEPLTEPQLRAARGE